VDAAGRGHVYTAAMAEPIKLVDRFGGLGDALEEAKRRIGLAPGTKVQIFELPKKPSSLLGVVGDLLGARATDQGAAAVIALPIVKSLLRGVPGSILVGPDEPQARLPVDILFE
jgi:protease-4